MLLRKLVGGAAASVTLLFLPGASASILSHSQPRSLTQLSISALGSAKRAGGSPCGGSSQVSWKGLGLYSGVHGVQLGCRASNGVAYFLIHCSSRLYDSNGQLADAGASAAGPRHCAATNTTPNQYLIGTSFTHAVTFSITIVAEAHRRIVWSGGSKWCTGGGTPTETCTARYSVSAGSPASQNYG